MSDNKTPLLTGVRHLHAEYAPEAVDIDMVTDRIMQVVFYVDVLEGREEQCAYKVALAVDEIASYLDFYKRTNFRTFDICFTQARNMMAARKLRDRKTTPPRG